MFPKNLLKFANFNSQSKKRLRVNHRLSFIVLPITAIFLLLAVDCRTGNPDTSGTGSDKTRGQVLAQRARNYLSNSWDWFIPPAPSVWRGGDGSLRNQSGAYPWADQNLGETRTTCNDKLSYARRPSQSNWSQYAQSASEPRAGWPQPPGASNDHKAGFVCYLLVAQAMKDAGFEINPNQVPNADWFLRYPVVSGAVQVGDIVLYDFHTPNSSPVWEHIGIITDVSAGNQNQYSVVSSIGIVEHFSYGGAEKRLGIFGSAATGGDFSEWNSAWEPASLRIVRPQ